MIADGAKVFSRGFIRGFQPPPKVNLWQWADKNRMLTGRTSGAPGLYESSRVPFWIEPMECLSADSPVRTVTLMKGAQVGGTEVANNLVGYVMDHWPQAMLFVMPTVELAKKNTRTRIDPMIQDCPRLKALFEGKGSGANTILLKEFPSGMYVGTGANSSAGMRSMPAPIIVGDEVDIYPQDVEGEGDPIILIKRAQRTFPNCKSLWISTPTFKGRSRVEELWTEGDQGHYWLPCPHCGELGILYFSPKKGGYFLQWDGDDHTSVRAVCSTCAVAFEEHEKTKMLAAGQWIPKHPERSHDHRSFHISSLYSPIGWRSWGGIVETFLKAKDKPDKLRPWTNHDLGETWLEKGDAPDWRELYDRREKYPIGTVPKGGHFLTAGVDIQGGEGTARMEVEVVAWGPGKESWSVEYFVIPGSAGDPKTWLELDALLERTWPVEGGGRLPIKAMAVDSGFNAQNVYSWCRGYPATRVMAVKGGPIHAIVGHPKKMDVTKGGRVIRRGILLWPVGSGTGKEEFYGFAKLKAPTEESGDPYPAGFCHFPEYVEERFKQLTSEQLIATINRKGFRVYEWSVIGNRRNEHLDCRVYARAAAAITGIDRFGPADWERMKADAGLDTSTVLAEKPTKKKKKRGGYLKKHRGPK